MRKGPKRTTTKKERSRSRSKDGFGLPSKEGIAALKRGVKSFYKHHGRTFPWRDDPHPYAVLVSEIMLQQTQTDRVRDKFTFFMERFPTVRTLACASLGEVLKAWSGLGYNRRAKFLWETARRIEDGHGGNVPRTLKELEALPSIGAATAAAISAFAFNAPVVFIETNIRAVFIDAFFFGRDKVSDDELMPYVEAALDKRNPREWYSALMDYGVMLKGAKENPGRKSRHYVRQSRFEGSARELRGAVIKALLKKPRTEIELRNIVPHENVSLRKVLDRLVKEGLVSEQGKVYRVV